MLNRNGTLEKFTVPIGSGLRIPSLEFEPLKCTVHSRRILNAYDQVLISLVCVIVLNDRQLSAVRIQESSKGFHRGALKRNNQVRFNFVRQAVAEHPAQSHWIIYGYISSGRE